MFHGTCFSVVSSKSRRPPRTSLLLAGDRPVRRAGRWFGAHSFDARLQVCCAVLLVRLCIDPIVRSSSLRFTDLAAGHPRLLALPLGSCDRPRGVLCRHHCFYLPAVRISYHCRTFAPCTPPQSPVAKASTTRIRSRPAATRSQPPRGAGPRARRRTRTTTSCRATTSSVRRRRAAS